MSNKRISRRTLIAVAGGTAGMLAIPPRFGDVTLGQSAATPVGSPTAGTTIDHPMGADDLVLRIEYVGGFAPVQLLLSSIPPLSLYGDGLAVVEGPQIAIHPAPALPNLRQMRLTEEGIQAVLGAAADAGIIGADRRYDNPMVADAAYTLITVIAGGTAGRVAVEALGIGENPEWTPAEREQVAAIQRFFSQAIDLASWLPPEAIASAHAEYPTERLQVTASPMGPPVGTPEANDPGLDQTPVDWPLATALSALPQLDDPFGGVGDIMCGVLTGGDAQTIVQIARDTNVLTPWISEGQRHHLTLRPLLPDETGCPPHPLSLDVLPDAEATPSA
jgi:hypothetical protein